MLLAGMADLLKCYYVHWLKLRQCSHNTQGLQHEATPTMPRLARSRWLTAGCTHPSVCNRLSLSLSLLHGLLQQRCFRVVDLLPLPSAAPARAFRKWEGACGSRPGNKMKSQELQRVRVRCKEGPCSATMLDQCIDKASSGRHPACLGGSAATTAAALRPAFFSGACLQIAQRKKECPESGQTIDVGRGGQQSWGQHIPLALGCWCS